VQHLWQCPYRTGLQRALQALSACVCLIIQFLTKAQAAAAWHQAHRVAYTNSSATTHPVAASAAKHAPTTGVGPLLHSQCWLQGTWGDAARSEDVAPEAGARSAWPLLWHCGTAMAKDCFQAGEAAENNSVNAADGSWSKMMPALRRPSVSYCFKKSCKQAASSMLDMHNHLTAMCS
jgi:hypothetical protein